MSAPTVESGLNRAVEFVETTLENLAQTVDIFVTRGLNSEVVFLKDGKEVQEVPAAIATVLALIGLYPAFRLLSLIAAVSAAHAGYTFIVRQRADPADSGSRETTAAKN